MPLIAGKTHYAIGKNIKTEMEHGGKSRDQAIAIAMSKAGMTRKKKRAKTIVDD